MRGRIKVSAEAVKSFNEKAVEIREFSNRFDSGINVIEQFVKLLSGYLLRIGEQHFQLTKSEANLELTIKKLKEKLAPLTDQLEKLKVELSSLEFELATKEPAIITADEEGNECKMPNPCYVDLSDQITDIRDQMNSVISKITPVKIKIEHADKVRKDISKHLVKLNEIRTFILKTIQTCRILIIRLQDILDNNKKQGIFVTENLANIGKIIDKYLQVRMIYEKVYTNRDNWSGNAFGDSNVTIIRRKEIKINAKNVINKTINAVANQTISKETGKLSESSAEIRFYKGEPFGGKYNSYEDRLNKTLSDNDFSLGEYVGERGESKYIPSNRSAKSIIVSEKLEEYGLDGIVYINGEPDFRPCADAEVKIPNMTDDRYSRNPELGNFMQADMELAEKWNASKRTGRMDWQPRDVEEYRKQNKLTWHEKCDTRTMILVPRAIHEFFKHSGGCAECKTRDASLNDGGDFDE